MASKPGAPWSGKRFRKTLNPSAGTSSGSRLCKTLGRGAGAKNVTKLMPSAPLRAWLRHRMVSAADLPTVLVELAA